MLLEMVDQPRELLQSSVCVCETRLFRELLTVSMKYLPLIKENHYLKKKLHSKTVHYSRYDIEMPIYVNMVRDPVERIISWYYYVR